MVSSKLLYLMHKPLNEIFSPSPNICYSGQREICISQLQRNFCVNKTATYESFKTADWWHRFTFTELEKIMRQKVEKLFGDL